ncbi:PhzF family phenazine biosynthesis protein [Corynebacterium lizhenjunii]|uniref:PhzF family phenazine biosynthesis protein n=1 Tax=Corynebacterium lizhenjunii TaxID=2709394 RepID=UPI0013EE2D17|nr:PhzF family phenazine biosynthesis protein [Corynebacterium lizhenjunii]
MQHPYMEVDVFSQGAFSGNPVAVIADADALSTAQMQRIAAWINFSETTFLCAPTTPGADYRVRIFTPVEEFPFAGHPTLGAAAAYAHLSGTTGDLVQECGIGKVVVRRQGERFAFATPPLQREGELSPQELAQACEFVGIAPQEVTAHGWVDNGPGWRLLQLADAPSVRALRPSFTGDLKVGVVGMTGAADPTAPLYEVRAFTPTFEDPVTGSFNGGAAQFLRAQQLVSASYTVAQGGSVGRDGRVYIDDDGTDIWVGGTATVRVHGTLDSGQD